MEQSPKTIKFVNYVKTLIDSGIVKNREEIVRELEWETTTLSNVMNGRRNVPNDIYKKFIEVYNLEVRPVDNNVATPKGVPLADLIEGNKALSLANKDLAAANLELTLLLKGSKNNSGNQQHISEVLEPYLTILADGLAGKSLLTENEVMKEIRKILTGSLMGAIKSGKQN